MIGMKKTASIVLIISVSLLLTVTTTTGAQAKATHDLYWTARKTYEGVPERMWVRDGILHVRNAPGEYTIGDDGGDFTGTKVSSENVNMDLATGNGVAWGVSILTVTGSEWGLTGTFEIRWTCKFIAGKLVSGNLIGHGSGGFEGWVLKCAFLPEVGGVLSAEGFLLDPHG